MRRAPQSLTVLVLAAAALGGATGLLWPRAGLAVEPIAAIFLRLVQSIIAPLVFATLTAGIAGSGNLKSIGRTGLRAAMFFVAVSGIALLLGYTAAAIVQPGSGVTPMTTSSMETAAAPSFVSILESVVPSNIFDAMTHGNVLQIVVFSILFGSACSLSGKRAAPVLAFADALGAIMMRYTKYVMYLAPPGVFAAMAVTTAKSGPRMLFSLGKYVLTVIAAETIFVAGVLLPIALFAGVPLRAFLRATRPPAVLAFSAASSQAALPVALDNMEGLGVPKQIAGFVLPAGMSFNLAGTTLFLALASAFVIQTTGVRLSFEKQATMLLTLALTSKGVAAVPRASYLILTATVMSVGVPAEAAAIVLGVDALLDMLRTGVNMAGNCLATAVIARWEGVSLARE